MSFEEIDKHLDRLSAWAQKNLRETITSTPTTCLALLAWAEKSPSRQFKSLGEFARALVDESKGGTINFSEHVCFDHDCIRIGGVEHHRPECSKATPGDRYFDDEQPQQETWHDRPSQL